MDAAELVFVGTAAAVGVAHTVVGVDHTLPILAVSRAEGWKLPKVMAVTATLGALHVASAALIFVLAETLGWPLAKLVDVETARGDFAARTLVLIGFAYGTLSLVRLVLRRSRALASEERAERRSYLARAGIAPYVVLASAMGPCEPLLPLLTGGKVLALEKALALGAFSLGTMGTMLGIVALGTVGLTRLSVQSSTASRLMPWTHVIAGYAIALSAFAHVA